MHKIKLLLNNFTRVAPKLSIEVNFQPKILKTYFFLDEFLGSNKNCLRYFIVIKDH